MTHKQIEETNLAKPLVKKLQWRENSRNSEWAQIDLSAGFSAHYIIDDAGYDLASVSYGVLCHGFGDVEIWKGPKDNAKDAAQTDYEAQALACLETE